VEGSYFGDVDIFIANTTNFERDSTAIATMESHFFVLAREVINQLKVIFKKEFEEMEELSHKRKRKHAKLIKELAKKVLKV
jgi:high-affinity Fe2+/Pb2+ permease